MTKDGLTFAAITATYGVLLLAASLNAAHLNARFGWAFKPLGEDPAWVMGAMSWFVIAAYLLWRHGLPKDRPKT